MGCRFVGVALSGLEAGRVEIISASMLVCGFDVCREREREKNRERETERERERERERKRERDRQK